MRVIDRPDIRALSPQGEIDRLNALVELKEARIAFLEGEVARLQNQKKCKGFEEWWLNDGSGIAPHKDEDQYEHAKRISRIAWHNGAYTALHPPYVPTCGDCASYVHGPYCYCGIGKSGNRVCKAFERRLR